MLGISHLLFGVVSSAQGDPIAPPDPADLDYARVYLSTDTGTFTNPYTVLWENVYGNIDAFAESDPTRLYVPTGFNYAQLLCHLIPAAGAPAGVTRGRISKNGGFTYDGFAEEATSYRATGSGERHLIFFTPIIPVSPGDNFQVEFHSVANTGSPTTVLEAGSYLEARFFT